MSATPWYKTNEFKISLAILTIGGAGTIVYDQVTSATIFTTLISVIKWCWNEIIFLLTYPVKVYWIVVFFTVLIGVLYVFSKLSKSEINRPKFLNYKSDVLKRWKWSWEYELRSKGYTVVNLMCYCVSCAYPMKYGKDYWGKICAECPKCKKYLLDHETEDITDIQIMIEHRINTKQFPGANS